VSLRPSGEPAVAIRSRHPRWRAIVIVSVFLLPAILMGAATVFFSTLIAAARSAYTRTIVDAGKEPAFLLTLAFILTFGVVRLITYSIRDHLLPFLRNVTIKGGLHLHHMVPGVLLVLISGYLGLVLPHQSDTRLLAVVFGVGAALVLDEFALLLNLADVYWQPAGRESIDAVILALGVATLYLLGANFWPALFRAALNLHL
jgi:hypothetical protein